MALHDAANYSMARHITSLARTRTSLSRHIRVHPHLGVQLRPRAKRRDHAETIDLEIDTAQLEIGLGAGPPRASAALVS
jgi:hypothetical protein